MKSRAPRSRKLKNIAHLSRMILGSIFIVSGFLKAIDPWGTSIKVDEYMMIYGLEVLLPISMIFSIWLCGSELMMGCMMAFKVRIRFFSIMALFSMTIFTIMTFLSATILPVEDCGCFGEAIRLTPWQTFFKNLILLPFAFIVWYRYRPDKILSFKKLELLLAGCFFSLSMGIGVYCYRHLPLIDYLPYKVGVNLPKAIEEAKKMSAGEFETVLIYRNKKSGKIREFDLKDTRWHDETKWEWVDTQTITEEPNIRALISEFSLTNSGGKDVTMELLTTKGVLNILFVTHLDDADEECIARMNKFIEISERRDEKVICVTPVSLGVNGKYMGVEAYNIDPTTMKTALRADMGLISLRDGVIVRKSNCRDI